MKLPPSKVIAHYQTNDKKIVKYLLDIDFNEWFKPKPTTEHELFLRLCRIILGQQLSGKAAETIYNRFVDSFDKKDISPDSVLAKDDQQLRDTGISWSKVRYIKDLAEKFKTGVIKFADMENLPDEQVINELTKIKGIGRWSAEMFLMFVLHRENIFAFDDLGLNKGIQKVYGLANPSKDRITKIIKKWEPYKTYGSIALWHSLET